MLHTIVLDLECRKHWHELSQDEEIGWQKLRNGEGGISALAIWDSKENWVYLYDDKTLEQAAAHIESANVVVTFRGDQFDLPCIEGLLKRKLKIKESVDLYAYTETAIGQVRHERRYGEYTLSAIARRTLGRGKTETGSHAPDLARVGEWAKLFHYCMNDVRLTRDLYYYILEESGIISAQLTLLPIELPKYIRESVRI